MATTYNLTAEQAKVLGEKAGTLNAQQQATLNKAIQGGQVTTQAPSLESKIQSGNFSASDAYAYNQAKGDNQAASKIMPGGQPNQTTQQNQANQVNQPNQTPPKEPTQPPVDPNTNVTATGVEYKDNQDGTYTTPSGQTVTKAQMEQSAKNLNAQGYTGANLAAGVGSQAGTTLPPTSDVPVDNNGNPQGGKTGEQFAWERDPANALAMEEQRKLDEPGGIQPGGVTPSGVILGEKKDTFEGHTQAPIYDQNKYNLYSGMDADGLATVFGEGGLTVGSDLRNELSKNAAWKKMADGAINAALLKGIKTEEKTVEQSIEKKVEDSKFQYPSMYSMLTGKADDGVMTSAKWQEMIDPSGALEPLNQKVLEAKNEFDALNNVFENQELYAGMRGEGGGMTNAFKLAYAARQQKDMMPMVRLKYDQYQNELAAYQRTEDRMFKMFDYRVREFESQRNMSFQEYREDKAYAREVQRDFMKYQMDVQLMKDKIMYSYGDLDSDDPVMQKVALERAGSQLAENLKGIPGLEGFTNEQIQQMVMKIAKDNNISLSDALNGLVSSIYESPDYVNYIDQKQKEQEFEAEKREAEIKQIYANINKMERDDLMPIGLGIYDANGNELKGVFNKTTNTITPISEYVGDIGRIGPIGSGQVISYNGAKVSNQFGQDPKTLGGTAYKYPDSWYPEGVPKGNHLGVDFAFPVGTQATAVTGGTVSKVIEDPNNPFGKQITVTDENGTQFMYSHLSSTQGLKVGDKIEKGGTVGLTGDTGQSTGPHLDITILGPDGKAKNPNNYFETTSRDYTEIEKVAMKNYINNMNNKEAKAELNKLGLTADDANNYLVNKQGVGDTNYNADLTKAFAKMNSEKGLNPTELKMITAELGSYEEAQRQAKLFGQEKSLEGIPILEDYISDLQKLKDDYSKINAGLGQLGVGGYGVVLENVKNQTAFKKLLELKEGGATFGALSEKEFENIGKTTEASKLKLTASQDDWNTALDRLIRDANAQINDITKNNPFYTGTTSSTNTSGGRIIKN